MSDSPATTCSPKDYQKGTTIDWNDKTVKELIDAFKSGHTTGSRLKST